MKNSWSLPLAFVAFVFASAGTCSAIAFGQAYGVTDNEYAQVQRSVSGFILPISLLGLAVTIWLLVKQGSEDDR